MKVASPLKGLAALLLCCAVLPSSITNLRAATMTAAHLDVEDGHSHDAASSSVEATDTPSEKFSGAVPEMTLETLSGARLLDTRGPGTIDGLFAGTGPIPDEGVIYVQVAGRGGVPTEAHSAMLSLVAVGASSGGFATLWPCESVSSPVPNSSVLNYNTGWTRANGVMVALGDTGGVCLYMFRSTDAVMDVQAFSTSQNLQTISPVRVADSRQTSPFAAGEVRRFDISDEVGSAKAAYLNITSVGNESNGHATIWPCQSTADSMPDSSILNHVPGQAVANNTLTGLSDGGFCIYSFVATEIIVDLMGFLTAEALDLNTITPYRAVDTRSDSDRYPSSYYASGLSGYLRAGETRMFQVTEHSAIPDNTSAIVANFTAVGPAGSAFLTAWPCNSASDPVPNTSMLNYNTGWSATPNTSVQTLSNSGNLCVYSYAQTDLIIDISSVIVDNSPPSITSDLTTIEALPAYEVRIFTCRPTNSSPFAMGTAEANFSPESVVDHVASSDVFSTVEEAFLGDIEFSATPGYDLGDCGADGLNALSIAGLVPNDNEIFVVQNTALDNTAGYSGLAGMGTQQVISNVAVDGPNWAQVMTHEFAHALFGWGHSGFEYAYPYASTFDSMSSATSERFYAHRFLSIGLADLSNFEVFGGQETTYTLHTNPSDNEQGLAQGETIGIFAPAASGVTHPGLYTASGAKVAVVVEGLDRGGSPELRDACNDSASSWECTGVIFSVVSYLGSANRIEQVVQTAASGTSFDSVSKQSYSLERTFAVRVGETQNVNGLTVTVNSFDRSTGTFSVTLSGSVTESFSNQGVYFPL